MNGRRNVFMTKSPRKNVPDVGILAKVIVTDISTDFKHRSSSIMNDNMNYQSLTRDW